VRSVLLVLTLALPIWADPFPTYSYFYSCDSGVVDCTAFPRHWYGDYGMNGIAPDSEYPGFQFHATASNVRGEAIGADVGGTPVAFEAAYGKDGVITALWRRIIACQWTLTITGSQSLLGTTTSLAASACPIKPDRPAVTT